MTRDEAMRAALETAYQNRGPNGVSAHDFATAGADAELARVVEWLRGKRDSPAYYEVTFELGLLLEQLEARAHWKEGA